MNVEKKRPRSEKTISFWKKIEAMWKVPVIKGKHSLYKEGVGRYRQLSLLYLDTFKMMRYSVENLKKIQTPLAGFTVDTLYSKDIIEMMVEFGQSP
jgi:hypothetical protein